MKANFRMEGRETLDDHALPRDLGARDEPGFSDLDASLKKGGTMRRKATSAV